MTYLSVGTLFQTDWALFPLPETLNQPTKPDLRKKYSMLDTPKFDQVRAYPVGGHLSMIVRAT